MTGKTDDISQQEIAKWGTIAMFAGGIAVLSGILAVAMPPNLLSALHTSRLAGAVPSQVENRLNRVLAEQDRIVAENDVLRLQITQLERERNRVTERVGALESAIPALLEVVPPDAEVDRTLLTASIGDEPTDQIETEGGSFSVVQRPLFDPVADADSMQVANADPAQPLPATVDDVLPDQIMAPMETPDSMMPDAADYGVMLGTTFGDMASFDSDDVGDMWTDILNKVGLLLIGTEPQVADPLGNGMARLVAGPLPDLASADEICTRIVQVGIECRSVQYEYTPENILASR